MPALDTKGVGALIKSIGPTDEHRQTLGRTFLGSLLGQTIVFIGMLLAYILAIVLLWNYAIKDLKSLYSTVGAVLFWLIILAPFVCILLFSVLPTGWRALRERRLNATIISGGVQFKPGYFRLYPYGAGDREAFKRLDGADVAILNWLKSTRDSLLYLSGDSGVGKSSILAAYVVPKLLEDGWITVTIRLHGDPMEQLRGVLLDTRGLFARKPASDTPLVGLLKTAADRRAQQGTTPLLVIVDQFEEFLILNSPNQRAPFAALLDDLANAPVKGLRLLLVFRSDYRSLIFKLGLPPVAAEKNWQELAPYNRGEATSFLQAGGRELTPASLDAIFRGLDRIEDARGVYRPITLNMIGLVLEQMGPSLRGDPARLIQSYLLASLDEGPSRDFARAIVGRMITDVGTKEPRSESELAALTNFEPWQIKATLTDLAKRGLVRPLEGLGPIWEISHDFLARVLGQLLGRTRQTFLQLVRPLIAPAVLLGWVAFASLALPYWVVLEQRSAETSLRALGASFSEATSKGLRLFIRLTSKGQLADAQTSLEQLTALTEIEIWEAQDIAPLRNLAQLNRLELVNSGDVSLEAIRGLTKLTELKVTPGYGVVNLDPLEKLTNLNKIQITYAVRLTSLAPLRNLRDLTELEITNSRNIVTLEPLGHLVNLSRLSLYVENKYGNHDENALGLDPLRTLTQLTNLNIAGRTGVTNVEALQALTQLKSLNLSGTDVTNLKPLENLTQLVTIGLARMTIVDLEPLMNLRRLKFIDLRDSNISPQARSQLDRLPVKPVLDDDDPRVHQRI